MQRRLKRERSSTDVVLEVHLVPLNHQRSSWRVEINKTILSLFIRLCIYPLRYSPTVVAVQHCGVFGKAWVKVRHQRSDVLSSCEQLVDYISSVDETWKRKTYWGLQRFSQKCHLVYQTWHFAFWVIIFASFCQHNTNNCNLCSLIKEVRFGKTQTLWVHLIPIYW